MVSPSPYNPSPRDWQELEVVPTWQTAEPFLKTTARSGYARSTERAKRVCIEP